MEFQTIERLIGVISSGFAAVGSLLLSDKLEAKAKPGAWLVFAGFVIYALWNSYLLSTLTGTVVLVIVIGGLLWGLRKQIFKKR